MLQLSLNRHAHQALPAFAGPAVAAAASAHLFGALAHADEAEVAVRAVRRARLVEAAPVVTDAEPDVPRVEVEVNSNGARLRVAHGVVDGLLPDAQEVVLDLRRERAERAADLELRLHVAPGCETARHLGERGRQVALFERLRAQVPDVAPRLRHAAANERARAVEVSPGRVR